MDTSDAARNKAIWEVNYNLPPSNTNNTSAEVRAKYEAERAHQEQAKGGKK